MEKTLLSRAPPRPRASLTDRLWTACSFVCIAYTLSHLVGSSVLFPSPAKEATEVRGDEPKYFSYAGEHVKWKACGELAGHDLECSDIDVPIDHFDTENSNDKVFNIGLIRLRGREATHGKNILLNPGGPGGSGLEFLYRRGEQLNTIIGEGFHLLAFDPRGVNTSVPQALCYPDQATRNRLSSVRNKEPAEDSAEIFAWAANFVHACADTTGEHGKYINTPQTAADMNTILDAVGQEKMLYWGFSYGSILGQTYAMMFPKRSHRVIVDAVANIFDWYEAKLDVEMFTDTENVLDGFFEECIKAGEKCALSEFADTKEELKTRVLDLGKSLKEQPVSVYVDEKEYGSIDYEMVFFNALFPALYKPTGWHGVAQKLASFLKGNATDLYLAYGIGSAFGIEGEAYNFVTLNDGVTGPEYWTQDRDELYNELIPFINSSSFALTENTLYYQKQKWALPNTHNFHPGHEVETAHPLLILSTTYDPVCPLISAETAQDAFKDSRLVEVLGYGHGSIAMPSACLAAHVRNYFYHGKLPETDSQCEVDVGYFLPPEEQISALIRASDNDPEKEKLYLAQLKLAQEMEWARR